MHLTEKQRADGAAKVWSTLETQLSKVLCTRQLNESMRIEVQACVAEAAISVRHSAASRGPGSVVRSVESRRLATPVAAASGGAAPETCAPRARFAVVDTVQGGRSTSEH